MKNRLVKMISIVLFPLPTWPISAPAGLETETWHMSGLCLSLLCGLILKPLSEPVISLIVLGLGACFVEKSAVLHNGYTAQGVWFLLAVFLACGVFKKAGLGKCLVYILLSKFGGTKSGRSSLGLGYVMMLCDLILSPVTESNTSRSATILPISRGVSKSLGSYPDRDPQELGGYLELLEHVVATSTAVLFLTGMASNAVITSTIKDIAGVELTWMLWFRVALVPGLIVSFLCPLVVYKLYPPQMKDLGDIKPFVVSKMQEMGVMKKDEKILLALLIMTILGWVFGGKIGVSMCVAAFVFPASELLLEVMDRNDLMAGKGTWNMYIWYGAFFSIPGTINEGGFYSWLSGQIQSYLDLSTVNGMAVLVILLLISFVTKYPFVSNVAYIASIYPAILILAVSTDVNIMTLSLMLAFFGGHGAFLCNYGNGASIYIFGNGYVSQKDRYLKGTTLLAMIFTVLLTIGLPYWKIMGIYQE